MAKYEWSEVFMSIEGEARYSGHPTVYIRFARCNFQCKGFNNPDLRVEKDGYASLIHPDYEAPGSNVIWDPKDYKTLESIPLITRGCDSQYAVNDKFAHMWHKGDEKALAAEVLKVLPHNTFKNPVTGKRVILSLTGGEPTIRLKFWVPILDILWDHGMRSILVETNGAAPLREKDLESLYNWVSGKNVSHMMGPPRGDGDMVKIIWSNSPKISGSGEVWKDAIRPAIITSQFYPGEVPQTDNTTWLHNRSHPYTEQYFKYVCGPYEADFAEVANAMEEYYQAGIPRDADVYIMPVACTEEQQQEISAKVAAMCMQHGYIYCHRIQNSVFGNGVGT
jgi:organic radical activating enzyme